MRRSTVLLLTTAALSPALAACGGDDDEGTTSTTGATTSTQAATTTTGAGTTTAGGGTSTGAGTSTGGGTSTGTGTTAGGDGDLEGQYLGRVEAACARVVAAQTAAQGTVRALRADRTTARLKAFGSAYANYFDVSATAIRQIATEEAPPEYDLYREGTRAQADVLEPAFAKLGRQARAARSSDDIKDIVDALPPVLRRLPKVPNPPAAFEQRAPSCRKVAQQGS